MRMFMTIATPEGTHSIQHLELALLSATDALLIGLQTLLTHSTYPGRPFAVPIPLKDGEVDPFTWA